MQFALLGNHPDGLDMARALIASGRHQMLYHATVSPTPGTWPAGAQKVHDIEEILADPAVAVVLVASAPAHRAAHLRRVLQAEREALCVHPLDSALAASYEADLLRRDLQRVLLPLLPGAFHPAVLRLKAFLTPSTVLPRDDRNLESRPRAGAPRQDRSPEGVVAERPGQGREGLPVLALAPESGPGVGSLRLIEIEHWSNDEVLLNPEIPDQEPCFPDWDILRFLGGEIAEVSTTTPGPDVEPGAPVLLSGCFEQGGLFTHHLVPHAPEPRWRLRLITKEGVVELLFPLGSPGPAFLTWSSGGELQEEAFDPWDPWPVMVDQVEQVLGTRLVGGTATVSFPINTALPSEHVQSAAHVQATPPVLASSRPTPSRSLGGTEPRLCWEDEVRSLELDDASRRSARKRRASLLEYPETSEEVSFKGTMTLVGCGLLWAIIFLAILSSWKPWLGWGVGPLLALFLILQLFRWIIPKERMRDEG
jgi:hypothetical protein